MAALLYRPAHLRRVSRGLDRVLADLEIQTTSTTGPQSSAAASGQIELPIGGPS